MACESDVEGRHVVPESRAVKFGAFEKAAEQAWSEIPQEYLDGIDGLTIREEALSHPDQPNVYTLGECVTEGYPSTWGGPETVRSTVVLYYGSFKALAAEDPDFDWVAEVWETLTHELRHHLESLAGQDDLEGVDYVLEQDAHRGQGDPFDPFYYQHGEEIRPGVFRAEDLTFVERVWVGDAPPTRVEIELVGWTVEVEPARVASGPEPDIHYVVLVGFEDLSGRPVAELVERANRTEIVLIKDRTLVSRLKDAASGQRMRVLESEVVARALPRAN